MIRIYDIGKDKKYDYPALIVVKEFKTDVNVSNQHELISFMNGRLNIKNYDNEHIFLITTDLYDNVVAVFLVGIGNHKNCTVYNKTIATGILLSGGRKFLIAHNHPDGALYFSQDDLTVVGLMKMIAALLEVDFINSYVVTSDGFITDNMTKPIYYKYWRK